MPEIILVLGGQQYYGAVYCLPPLITACSFQFIYTMYVNIEFYEKKTLGVSISTMIATALNIILNIVLIPLRPEYSHVIAAYTTLLSFIVLFILHFFLVKRMKMDHVYDTRLIMTVLFITLLLSVVMYFLYRISSIRYVLTVIYGIILIFGTYRYKEKIIDIFKGRL